MDAPTLVADCSSCFGLCCVGLAFSASSDFAVDKDAGDPCVNLDGGFGCTIHARLRESGYRGCTVYDCLGAGQQVSQVTFGGVSWRDAPETSGAMFAALPVMHQLHELIAYVAEARELPEAASLAARLDEAYESTIGLTRLGAADLLAVDVDAHRATIAPLLSEASRLARAGLDGPQHRGADLVARVLRDLRGADLRGALLIAADLHGADLRQADLIGADLRDADLTGADLDGALFLTQAQVNGARGDGATILPAHLEHPEHWGR